MNKIKENITINNLVYLLMVIIFIIMIVLSITRNYSLSRFEKVQMTNLSNELSDYLEELLDYKDDEGKYISFVTEYYISKNNVDTISYEDMNDLLDKYFDFRYTDKDIISIGSTKRMQEKGLTNTGDGYRKGRKLTKQELAYVPIIKYDIKNIKKNGKDKFSIKYVRYEVKNPYDLLNYYTYDVKDDNAKSAIMEYLNGTSDKSKIKKYITAKNISKIGKKSGEFSVTFVIKNNKLIIK